MVLGMRSLLFGSSFSMGFDSSVVGGGCVFLYFAGCLAGLVVEAPFRVAFSTAWWVLEKVNGEVVIEELVRRSSWISECRKMAICSSVNVRFRPSG